jgi:hypothetical protein
MILKPSTATSWPRVAAFSTCLLLLFVGASPVWAWGRLGHRVIARLAEKHMTPQAKAAVAAGWDGDDGLDAYRYRPP